MCWGMPLLLWQWFLGNSAALFLAVASSQGFVTVSGHEGVWIVACCPSYTPWCMFYSDVFVRNQYFMANEMWFSVFNGFGAGKWDFSLLYGVCGGGRLVGSTTNSSVILSLWEIELERFNFQEAFSYRIYIECNSPVLMQAQKIQKVIENL